MVAAHEAYLALGSNLGDRHSTINCALELLENNVGRILRKSKTIETKPEGFASDNLFLNLCLCIETTLTPQELLHATQNIERQLGRTAKSANGQYHDRTIDIDILLYDDLTIDTPELQIPHPRMHERDFVMRPLMEIKR